jgi:hypothetical protein
MGGRGGALMGIQLNANEKAAIETITEKYRPQYQELRQANQGKPRDNGQLATQMQLLVEREQAEIRAALTAEHQAQFDANLAKRKDQAGRAGGPGRRPPRPPADSR